jgi:hypothetical protein
MPQIIIGKVRVIAWRAHEGGDARMLVLQPIMPETGAFMDSLAPSIEATHTAAPLWTGTVAPTRFELFTDNPEIYAQLAQARECYLILQPVDGSPD